MIGGMFRTKTNLFIIDYYISFFKKVYQSIVHISFSKSLLKMDKRKIGREGNRGLKTLTNISLINKYLSIISLYIIVLYILHFILLCQPH